MKFISTITLFVVLLFPLTSKSQGWQWGKETKFADGIPFEDNFLQAFSSDGYLYTYTSLGSQSGSSLLGEVTYLGALSVTDSFNCVQIILSKMDTGGNYIWNLASQGSDAGFTNIATDYEGNTYITGVFDSAVMRLGTYTVTNPNTPNYSTFLAKVNSAGSVVWARTIARVYADGMDDMRFGQGAVGVDAMGEVYVTGTYTLSSITIGGFHLPLTYVFDNDLYLAKYDSTGNLIWAKSFGNVSAFFTGNNMVVTRAGGLYLSGQYQSSPFALGTISLTSPTGYGIFLTYLDSTGTPLWARSAPGGLYDLVNGMAPDKDMNIYMTGGFHNTNIVFGTDTLANTATVGGSADVFLVKYDSLGNEKWARSAGGYGEDMGFSVAPDTFGNVWLIGNMAGGLYTAGYVMNFGSPADSLRDPAGADPLFIAQYNYLGTYLSSFTTYSLGDDQANILVDNNKNFYISGDWLSSTEVFGPDTIPYEWAAYEKAVTVKYNYNLLMAPLKTPDVQRLPTLVSIYPNPAEHMCTISLKNNTGSATADMYDLTGRLVRSFTLSGGNTVISLEGISPGIYFCKVLSADKSVQTVKLVVQ